MGFVLIDTRRLRVMHRGKVANQGDYEETQQKSGRGGDSEGVQAGKLGGIIVREHSSLGVDPGSGD